MNKAFCNGVGINYQCVGEGNDVVLIHGFAANHAFWNLPVLLGLSRKYRVTLYDLRGHGYSEMPVSGYTSAIMAEDLLHLLNHNQIKKAHIVGHSFGGVVALHFAALYPERVEGLTLVDSRVRALQPTQKPKDWHNWSEAKKNLERLNIFIPEDEPESGLWLLEKLASREWRNQKGKLEGSQLFMPFCGKRDSERSAERWLELLKTTTARHDLLSLAGLTIDLIRTVRVPILAMYGEHSRVMPTLQKLRTIFPNIQTYIIPKAGHFFPKTQPNLFLEMLCKQLKECHRLLEKSTSIDHVMEPLHNAHI